MLVTNRYIGQAIVIRQKDKPDIVVTILETGGRSARIGIDAPDDVTLIREELLPRTSEVS